jgi:phosphoribosyl-ATP pyrophosphohydrolase
VNDSLQDNPVTTDDTFARLAAVIESRKPANGGDAATSYIARLFAKGPDAALKKVGEGVVGGHRIVLEAVIHL